MKTLNGYVHLYRVVTHLDMARRRQHRCQHGKPGKNKLKSSGFAKSIFGQKGRRLERKTPAGFFYFNKTLDFVIRLIGELPDVPFSLNTNRLMRDVT